MDETELRVLAWEIIWVALMPSQGSLWRDGGGIGVTMEVETDVVRLEGGGPQAKVCRQSLELKKAEKWILPRAS